MLSKDLTGFRDRFVSIHMHVFLYSCPPMSLSFGDSILQGCNFGFRSGGGGHYFGFFFYPVGYTLQTAYQTTKNCLHGPKAHRCLVVYHIAMIKLGRTKMSFQNVGATCPPFPVKVAPLVFTQSVQASPSYFRVQCRLMSALAT